MMKKNLFLLLITISFVLNAQGRRKDQSLINVEYGYIPEKMELQNGYSVKLGYGRVIGNQNFLGKIEVFYSDFSINYIDKQILPYKNFGINVNAGYSIENLYPIMINAWVGGYGAYEIANDGEQRDTLYSAEIPVKVKGLTYGISGSAEAEIYIIHRMSLLLNYTQFYDLKSDFSKSNYALYGGLRFYIN